MDINGRLDDIEHRLDILEGKSNVNEEEFIRLRKELDTKYCENCDFYYCCNLDHIKVENCFSNIR